MDLSLLWDLSLSFESLLSNLFESPLLPFLTLKWQLPFKSLNLGRLLWWNLLREGLELGKGRKDDWPEGENLTALCTPPVTCSRTTWPFEHFQREFSLSLSKRENFLSDSFHLPIPRVEPEFSMNFPTRRIRKFLWIHPFLRPETEFFERKSLSDHLSPFV